MAAIHPMQAERLADMARRHQLARASMVRQTAAEPAASIVVPRGTSSAVKVRTPVHPIAVGGEEVKTKLQYPDGRVEHVITISSYEQHFAEKLASGDIDAGEYWERVAKAYRRTSTGADKARIAMTPYEEAV